VKVEKSTIKGCCGKNSIIFKIDKPITRTLLDSLVKIGFHEHTQFSKVGMMYIDNVDFIITGQMGSDKMQIKCKYIDCDHRISNLENTLLSL